MIPQRTDREICDRCGEYVGDCPGHDHDESLEEQVELLLTALNGILPIHGSWTNGYEVLPQFDNTLRATHEEWAEAAYYFCNVHRLMREAGKA